MTENFSPAASSLAIRFARPNPPFPKSSTVTTRSSSPSTTPFFFPTTFLPPAPQGFGAPAMVPCSSSHRDGSATVCYDCALQSDKSGSNAYPWVPSAPSSSSLDPQAQQNGDLSSNKAASVSVHSTVAQNSSSLLAASCQSTGWQPDFQQGPTFDSPALHVFDGMPTPCYGMASGIASSLQSNQSNSHTGQDHQMLDTSSCSDYGTSAMTWSYCPTLQGRVLSMVMHQVKHPVPIGVLNHLFSLYGVVETVFQSLSQHGRKVLIQYKHGYMAEDALRATHGWYLYGTYCQLDIRHADHTELQLLADHSWLATPPRNDQPSEKQTVTEAQSIGDMMAQIQAKLKIMSENLSQALKRMKSMESKQPTASQPNHSTQEAMNMSGKMPLYDVYAEEENICSIGSCNVSDTNLIIPQDGEGKPEIEHTPKYFSNPSENEIPSQQPPMSATATHQIQFETSESTPNSNVYEKEDIACLNIISDVLDFTLELQQQDDQRASNCLVWKASVSFITRSSQLSIEHTMRELRLLWDPGSLKSIMDAPALVKFSSLEGLAHVVIFSPNILLPMSVYAATSIPNILSLPMYILWDTGDTKYHAMFTTAAGATKFQCVDICKPTMVQKLDVHFRARSESILESAIMSSCAFGLGRTEVNAHQLRDPPLKVLVTPERRKEWDPGEHTFRSSTQNRDIVSVLQTSILTQETTNRPTQCISLKYWLQSAEIKYPCIPSYFFYLRYTNVKCNCWLITVLQSIDDQVKCLNPLSLTTPWDPGVLVILHSCTATHPIVTHPGAFAHVMQSIFSSTECYYVLCLGGTEAKTTTVLVLVIPCSKGKSVSMHSLCSCQMVTIAGQTITFQSCATKSVQVTKNKHPREFLMAEMLLIVSEFRDGQLTYMPQSPTINSSEFERHMVTVLSCWLSSLENRAKLQWDPGIAISSYMLNWLKMRAVKTLHWLKRPLLNDEEYQSAMSNTPCVWDPGIESLPFPCNRLNITELIQIKRWTSITYSGISLSEYPYTMIFLHDQWEFIHQQCIQENYNPKLLLSSQDCAKVQEMDVIFITFLPP